MRVDARAPHPHLGCAMRVICSNSCSVYDNLAWEEWLLDRFAPGGDVLFLSVNAPAVVMGKNQNPWREADPAAIRRDGVALARRVSGGGTVYHDEGNLNYSLILPRHSYRPDEVFRRLIAVLLGLGIAAERMPGNSLGVGGRKISGSAFCYRGPAVLHHGTLLLRADRDRLHRYLQPALPDIQTRAIASNPMPTVNLGELKPALTAERVQHALAAEFAGDAPLTTASPPADHADWSLLRGRQATWDWVYGYTPSFTWSLEAGGQSLALKVDRGLVAEAGISGGTSPHPALLAGCEFSSEALAARLRASDAASPLAACLRALPF